MVDTASMTDAELRTKLLEFGFPVMPITGTTRKLMEKKLKILLENKSKVTSEGRRSLARYSSEEESDIDVKVSKRDKSKRQTMAAPSSKATLRKNTRKVENESENEVTRKPIVTEEKKVTTRTTKITKVESGFDTGSDSESDIVEQTYKSSTNTTNSQDYKTNFPQSAVSSTVSSSYVDRKFSPPKISEDVVNKTMTYTTNQSPSRYTSYGSPNASDYASERLNQIRSRLSLGTPTYDRPTYSSPSTTTSNMDREEDNAETPFLSNFTKRLSQLSSTTPTKFDDYKNDVIKEQDTNGSGAFATRTYLSRPVKRDFARDYHTNKQTNTKNNMVSFAVIALAFLFFIVLAIAYMGLHNGQTALDTLTDDIKVVYCDKIHGPRPGVNCLLNPDVRNAVAVYQVLKPELLRRAVDGRCVDAKLKRYLTEIDSASYIGRHIRDKFDANKSLRDMEVLIFTNPQWEISLSKINIDVADTPIRTYDELFDARSLDAVIALSILDPSIPWSCSLYNKLTTIFQTLLILAIGFLGVYFLNIGYKYYKHYQQKQKDELFYMIERIIDILQTNAPEEGENFLVINHVRDMILPINDRARMEKTWRNAVDFINKNESRVRTELQVVQGEPYEVWRWLGSPSLNTSGSPRNKTWQGQAFETQQGSVNSLPCSPTPCLKIRGMVDEGDRNLHTIREAVLSKCAHQCRILHCSVDTNSKCVYLKCADQNDAAIAYRSLHGWWYAGNLVTVKYLRLERYMQRYADSPVNGPPYLKAVQPATDWSN